MPLTPEEMESLRRDAMDPQLKADLNAMNAIPDLPPETFEGYVKFLQDIQAIFGPMSVSREPMETRFNKL